MNKLAHIEQTTTQGQAGWNVDQWLAYLEDFSRGRGIKLGLERILKVYTKLNCPELAPTVVTVAGTNGKGTVCHLLYQSLHRLGYRVGMYTSPHFHRYNERVAFLGRLAEDEELIQAFEQIFQADEKKTLSYFEYACLAAFIIFSRAELDVIVLEVGLGGRYDAVNIIDPDLAIVTSVGLDHCNYLGHDLNGIAREKCGIMRKDRLSLFASESMPDAVLEESRRIGAVLECGQQDWAWQTNNPTRFNYHDKSLSCDLPIPNFCGQTGLDNVAVVVRALREIVGSDRQSNLEAELTTVLSTYQFPGRFHYSRCQPHILCDTAHNPPAVKRLLARIAQEKIYPATILLSVRRDKDLVAILQNCTLATTHWQCVSGGEDFYSATEIRKALMHLMRQGELTEARISIYDDFHEAIPELLIFESIHPQKSVHLVFGSFAIVAKILKQLDGD